MSVLREASGGELEGANEFECLIQGPEDEPEHIEDKRDRYPISQLRSDLRGFAWSLLLFQLVELLIMYTVVMSNERMNMDADVLPDSVLDLIPRQPLAGKISEVLLFSYQLSLVALIVLHERRMVLLRRFLTVQSVCFLIRLVCIWSDVLPRSYYTMECAPKAVDQTEVVHRVLVLWGSAGLAIFGGHMCGNYFFSGHTLMTVLIFHNLSHYMPARWWVLRKFNGLVALTIPVLILASHNHYTIDIIGSFIVGTWVFKLYTFIAENPEVETPEKWFDVWWLFVVQFMEREHEKVQYKFSGFIELLQFLKAAFQYLTSFNRARSKLGPGGEQSIIL